MASYESAKKELIKSCDNPYIVARAFLKQIDQWNAIKYNDSVALKQYKGSMSTLKHLQQLSTDMYLQKIVLKLSSNLQAQWQKIVHSLEENNEDISFSDLVDFINKQTKITQ